jgi:hypothetical protein
MKRIATMVCFVFMAVSAAGAFQGGGGEPSRTNRVNKSSSRSQDRARDRRFPNLTSLPIRLLRSLKLPNSSLAISAFSSDGELGVTVVGHNSGDDIEIYDLQTGLLMHRLRVHTRQIASVAFSPDGTMIVSGSHEFIQTNVLKGEARLGTRAPDNYCMYSADRQGRCRYSVHPMASS